MIHGKDKCAFSIALLSITFSLLICPSPTQAEQPTENQIRFFETNIRPALVKYCYQCHSIAEGDSRAGLLLDTRTGLLQGGDSGPAIAPGDLDESLLWEAINWDGYEMPPSKKMPAEVIAHFKTWIEMGAPDPRVRKLLNVDSKITRADIEKGKKHWAFQPLKPSTDSSIDGLVSDGLRQARLKPAAPASAFALLRRLNFDLIGLPPTPDEIRAFKRAWDKDSESAIRGKVDELLQRPQYGERWGRHWLDVARYAESSGAYNVTFPHAWRYRNYVIDSFNNDTPYDRFLAEQITGDLLPAKTDEDWQRNLIATGFLAIGRKRLNEQNPRAFIADMVDEQIDTLSQAVLGLTVSCARCHDHKFDPIPTHDYYAMVGIFQSTKTYYGTFSGGQNRRPGEMLLLPILDQPAEGNRSVEGLEAQIQSLRKERAQLREKSKASGEKDAQAFARLRRREAGMVGELATLNADGTKKTFGMGLQEAKQTVNANILVAGDVDQQAQQVPRGFLQVMGDLNFVVKDKNSSGRTELVNALTSTNNPLTSRVMVNRIWMHLTGRPLVGTPNNFGQSGLKPDNPELLDHLAIRFMNQNWSVKSIIREIVLSDAYQRSTRYNEQNYAVDPENKTLWRANARPMDAESLRDTILSLAGRIDLQRPDTSEVTRIGDAKFGRTQSVENFDANDRHRSVYLPIIRDELLEVLSLFDFPDPNVSTATRTSSIVPTQALYMMNDRFVAEQARAMATHLSKRFSTTGEQVQNAFLLAYARPATKEELQAAARFFKEIAATASPADRGTASPSRQVAQNRRERPGRRGRGRQTDRSTTEPVNDQRLQPLAVFCQTLMASAEFRLID